MTKDEFEYRLNEIEMKMKILQNERERLLSEWRKQNAPPPLGIHVMDEVGAEDKFGGA